jgi:hypothetical protein
LEEFLKTAVLTLLFPFLPEEFDAVEGTWKAKFFTWLLGPGEECHDGWIYLDNSPD